MARDPNRAIVYKLKKSKAELRADAMQRVAKAKKATIPNAALILGISSATLKTWVDQGKIMTMLFGKRQYLTLETLEEVQSNLSLYFDKRGPKPRIDATDTTKAQESVGSTNSVGGLTPLPSSVSTDHVTVARCPHCGGII